MRRLHVKILLVCILITLDGSRFASAVLTQAQALKQAYYAHIDLIRRGLPQVVVHAEFAWGINKLASSDSYFRHKTDLNTFPVWSYRWKYIFDPYGRTWYALKYLLYVKTWKPNTHFQTFRLIPRLPPMTPTEQTLVYEHWSRTYQNLRYATRGNYPLNKFSFPSNVEILYDIKRSEACQEYNKFGSLSPPEALDSEAVLASLTVSSILLLRVGGNQTEIEHMYRHVVAYIFNGVRCKRLEGPNIKVPIKLLEAYARHTAYIRANAVKPDEPVVITRGAVLTFYHAQIHSLTSYNSWGNVEYAVLKETTSIPIITNSMKFLFNNNSIASVQTLSSRQVSTDRGSSRSSKRNSVDSGTIEMTFSSSGDIRESDRALICSQGYTYVHREHVSHPQESCCSSLCYTWAKVMVYFRTSLIDGCCARCNQFSCENGITDDDVSNSRSTDVYVPEFGEQKSYRVCLVMI